MSFTSVRGEGATCGPAYTRGRALRAAPHLHKYRPDVGLLTSEPAKHDDELNPRIIAPDPFASDDCVDVFSPVYQLLLTTIEDEYTMNTSENEPSSGINGRLRPRRSTATSPNTNKAIRKPEPKTSLDRQKRTSTPSKACSTKPDDLAHKSDSTNTPQHLCPFCDRKFATKQTASQHVRRVHLSPKQDASIDCLFCNHAESDSNDIIRHMVDSHPNQYFACLDCHTRFYSTSELSEHKLNVCEKQKLPYRSKLRQKVSSSARKNKKLLNVQDKDVRSENFTEGHRFNGVVISCELKPSQINDEADIEDNITTNLILPPSKNLGANAAIEKNAVIVLDDIQWNKRMPTNFSFHNTDADQILSRLGVVHRSPRTGESTKKDWLKCAEEATQKFEKCFDTSFYSKVASNVHENMSKFLDGSFNFNPDPDSIIKTRKSKNSVVINAAEGFPILLACEQYSRIVFDGYMPRALAPKHKWKWENEKAPLNPDDIKHDTHVNNCIITLVSSLDIWTQLCMRRKFEDKFGIAPLEKKTEKQNAISKELKEILESRELPSSSQQVVKFINKPVPSGDSLDFPASLGLKPSAPKYDVQPAVLSGEWVRPRCYVCCACGAQTRDSRGLSSHISTQHPNAQVQYYEIVGELLLNADILKHLYVPPSQMCNRTRPLRGFRECTKCKKSISLEDLHQHMLDCAGDTPTVRRKCRYRPFGVRRRRTRLPDNTIRKKIRKDIRTRQTRQKTHMRPRPKIRTEVGDAETIRKMLADLPAKRHRVMVNPMNPILRPRRKLDQQRNKLIMKRRSTEILKNRKQLNLKGKSLSRTGSNSGDNDDVENKNVHKSDDENTPLKPKVKTMKITRRTRQTELKRKVALNRAKRRAQIKEQKANDEKSKQHGDMSASSSGNVKQMPIDSSPQRIDVRSGTYNTREHSSRGRSNNRDDQKPGPSSQDGNTHNSYAPPQNVLNVPLKHSIARLTADTDIHDKNIQFHHLYLMRPECNEVTQHVPTGQQRLFENEAVVTKLDKPPLHFNLSGSVDPYICQKNKQCNTSNNKRKGLNDCIAMLKNKAGQATESPDEVPCNSDDRLNCEMVATNQSSPNLDFQINMMNYDTNTRPAEIFSRHQFIPERFMEYHPESNLIAQNFADLPFHYLQSQRIAFDLPQLDSSRIDPRFLKPSKQKQNDGNQKPTRRRSTRAEKEQQKRQDYILRTSPVNYSLNVSTPSKATTAHSRRASTQSVAVSTNTGVTKRRSSGSYNQSRKSVIDYQNETMLLRQRPFEYHPHRISPETHLIELNHPEAYVEAQKNLQKQMIACAENYINKKQLAICVDTNYQNKKPNALSPEAVYSSSKQAASSGYDYLNMKQATEGSDSTRMNKNKQHISPVESNYNNKKKQVPNVKKTNYFYKKPSVSNTEIAYNKPYAAKLIETDLTCKAQAVSYVESTYVNKKSRAVSVENKSPHKAHAVPSSESFVNKAHAVGTTESNLMDRTQALPPTESNFLMNMAAQGVDETNFASKKHTTDPNETNFTPNMSINISEESNFITKKRAATSDRSFISKKQLATSESSFINNEHETSEMTFINKKQAATLDGVPVTKKQAVALENNPNKKQVTTPEGLTNKKLVSTTESNHINNIRPFPITESNISDKKGSHVLDEMYPESAFSNLPAIIPPAYSTVGANYASTSNEIEAPLDLSRSTAKENTEISEMDNTTYVSENFDNYETLDLSHKSSENNNDEIIDVVDLRVKVNSPTLDMSSTLPRGDDMDSATDLSIQIRDDDTPTDLTIKRKTNNHAYEYDSRNLSYDDVSDFVQDLRKTHPERQPNASSSNISDSNIPTDLSGRISDLPMDMVAIKSSSIPTHMDHMLECVESLKPADLSVREQVKQNSSSTVTNFMDCVQQTIIDESQYTTKTGYDDANVHPPMYSSNTQMTTNIATTVQATISTESVRSSNAIISSNSALPEKKQVVVETSSNTSLNDAKTVTGGGIASNAISSIASPIPLFTVANTVVQNISTSKYESTTPVYTLANACISMTKIEPSSTAILSIPNKTIVSAAPVYTLTDTTIYPTMHHGQVYNKSTQDALSATINYIYNSQNTTDSNASDSQNECVGSGLPITKKSADEQDKERSTVSGDLDPETAKKIAMLPKELVEILGTMPMDHRNQLLNVLPQYVSTPAPLSQNDTSKNTSETNTSGLNRILSPTRMSDSDVKPTLGYSPVSSSQSILPPPLIQPVTTSVACADKVDETKGMPPDAEIGKNEAQRPCVNEVHWNTIIDLTQDEPVSAGIKKIVVEPTDSEMIPLNNLAGVATNIKLNKQKVNDQTASLRAVRIKAPSERHKSLSIDNNTVSKNSCQEQVIKSNILYAQEPDTDVNQTTDLDKTLAIQQAEISSTQHNTMITVHGKYPLAISPSSTEYSGDESSKHVAQPSPIPVNEIVTKKLDNKKYETPTPKTGMVTSSISTNVLIDVDNSSNTIIDTNAQTLLKSCDVANCSLLISKSKESDIPNGEVTNLNAAENVEATIRCTKEFEYEEDSEDDMSLAAIIKQKLCDQLNVCEDNEENEKTLQQSNKKKKEKKSKRNTKKIAHDEILEDISFNDFRDSSAPKFAKSPQVTKVNDIHSDITNQVSAIPEHSKKRPKRGRRPVIVPDAVNIQSDKIRTIQSDKEINKENDVASKFMNNKSVNDYSMTTSIKGPIKESPPRSHDVVFSEDIQNEVTKIKTTLGVIKESSNDLDVSVRVRRLSDDMSNSSSITNDGKNNPRETKKRLEFTETITAKSTDKNKEQAVTAASETSKIYKDIVPTSMASVEFHSQSKSVQENRDSNVNLNSVNKKDKNTRSKKQKHEETEIIAEAIEVSHQITDSYDIEENTINPTPLRRSRRGKSLYLKSSLTDKDLYENTPEHKTPLTKKQLIFSKLRLDERTFKPQMNTTPETQNKSENVSNISTAEETLNFPQLSNIENPCETFEEKPKGTKRRNNTQLLKKSKKKKSIEDLNKKNQELNEANFENDYLSLENPSLLQNDSDKEQSESFNELSVASQEELHKMITPPHSPFLSTFKNNSNKNVLSTEKRKNYNQISFDLSLSPKPKKSKMTKANKKRKAEVINVKLKNNETEDTSVSPETKTACYNLQIPARRGRSKSVVVKSSGTTLYDPYDIDLEDMAEQNVTFKRKQYTGKNSRSKAVKSAFKNTNQPEIDECESDQEFDTKHDEKDISRDNNDMVDSDDSTRSDVPLKCYLNRKQKKRKSVESVPNEKETEIQREESENYDNKDMLSSSTDKTVDITQTQAEKDSRSLRFMQIFGFFSEKMPRKSNLLAMKKISETINITNESDDRYFGFKERSSKKNKRTEKKKSSKIELSKIQPQPSTSKKVAAKRGRKKQVCTKMIVVPRYCEICKQEFRRSDNYLRHAMCSLLHSSKLCETELKVKTIPVKDKPNYLITYKIDLERYKSLLDRLAALKKRNAKAAAKIPIPTQRDVKLNVEQIIAEREELEGLSKDEALFLSCCKLLKGANKDRDGSALENFKNALDEEEAKLRECEDDDVDSITAQSILESEEVRNLENDLISRLKEAAIANRDLKMNIQKANDSAIPQVVMPQMGTQVDVAQVDVALVEVAQVDVEQVDVAQVPIPQVAIPQVTVPQVTIPQVTITQGAIPEVDVVQVAVLQAAISQVAIPHVAIPKDAIPQDAIPQDVLPQVAVLQAAMPEVAMQQVEMPQVIISQIDPINTGNQINLVAQEELVHSEQTPEVTPDRDVSHDLIKETEFHEGKYKESNEQFSSPIIADCHYDNIEDLDVPVKSKTAKVKKHIEVKEKMYPDVIEDINMFEDKFDKIKRKCRSQAAAAKHPQPVIEQMTRCKGKKKSEKKKNKRGSKKAIYQNTQVPTKGALKGFDSIKVSIPTTDINLSSIVPVYESSPKKKKKSGSKRKRDKKDSESSGKYDSDNRVKDSSSNKKVDVYEFKDNDDAELFDFRPSTVMERFKSISHNKDMPSTSKVHDNAEDDNSSDSASDGDDFVYMSDDYVCSDDETENSLMSCEMSNAKVGNDIKKIASQKRKDAVEKNAVMGKIFKHNAVRAEKRPPDNKEPAKPKANLDQLFDSLLEEEPNSSVLNNEALSPKDDHDSKTKYSQSSRYNESSDILSDQTSIDDTFLQPQEPYSSSPANSDVISSGTLSKRRNSSPSKHHLSKKHNKLASKKYDVQEVNYEPSISKNCDTAAIDYGPSTSKKYDNHLANDYEDLTPKGYPQKHSKKSEEKIKHHEKKTKKRNNSAVSKLADDAFIPYDKDLKSPASKLDEGISTSYDYNTEIYDQSMLDDTAGVARHRARRKCTVGKQNVLSETWSSESELDGGPPRPKSVESVISCVGRKKKGRKKDGHQSGGRRGSSRQVGHKKQDIESRVIDSRSASGSTSDSESVAPVSVEESTSVANARCAAEVAASTTASNKAAAAAMPAPSTSHAHAHPVAGPSGVKGRRGGANFWSSEGGDEQEHLQQHGWIVGDSHKKLVTMLAHAKGRKRNDDKRHLVE